MASSTVLKEISPFHEKLNFWEGCLRLKYLSPELEVRCSLWGMLQFPLYPSTPPPSLPVSAHTTVLCYFLRLQSYCFVLKMQIALKTLKSLHQNSFLLINCEGRIQGRKNLGEASILRRPALWLFRRNQVFAFGQRLEADLCLCLWIRGRPPHRKQNPVQHYT